MSVIVGCLLALAALLPQQGAIATIGADHEATSARLPGMGGRSGPPLAASPTPLAAAGPSDGRLAGSPDAPALDGRPTGAEAGALGTSLQSGLATWYDTPGLTAAAGPELRVGDWRGSRVQVCGKSSCIVVTLTDACWCPDRDGVPVLLDLSASAFRRLAPLSRGVIAVEVTKAGRIELPPTDTAP